METKQKSTGWILIALIVLITGTALLANSLSGQAENDSSYQQHASVIRTLFPDASADGLERLDSDAQGFVYAVRQGERELGHAVQETGSGYAGPIEVTVAYSPDHELLGIHVGGAQFQETENLGAKAKEVSFTDQFRGRVLPIALGEDIEAISGATVTSQAVVDAVNQSLHRLARVTGITAPVPSANPTPAPGRTANASVIGYGGPVLVRLTLDEQGAIGRLEIGGARMLETDGIGSRVRDDPSFADRFVGKTPPLTLGEDVDALNGATVSSQAVVNAVNDAHAFLTSDSK